ncbi:hypothetical protein AYL99_08514 [Fonsecaea erecta]|uniref:DUF7066 domain-containing protein n=1 Tax=Fonsecaea erecta TaxID=1367422 RepID=A0A178ZE76_9EURO|nr:hypothetical protein AYL99_08514 [Fonsecaea erecta]OAP57776.1 hypothetical protein AYL99_08514 [Fonsecaea erecta]
MATSRISKESSIWDFKDTLFRALGAAYAALGEASFRRHLTRIADYYGDGATIHEIETLFTKDIPAKAEQLRRELANRHVRGNNRPLRGSAPSRRLPLLDFDDEEICVLNPREVEVLEVRSTNSLQAPAKRPRDVRVLSSGEIEVLKARSTNSRRAPRKRPRVLPRLSTTPPPSGDGPASGSVTPLQAEPNIPKVTASGAATIEFDMGLAIPDASTSGQNLPESSTREGVLQTRKRRFSEVQDPAELQTVGSPRSSPPPRWESFGYVTKKGEYRCALCRTQLPNANDLLLHEKISKEHIRSLKDKKKVTIGRERLAHLTAIPAEGHNASSSAFDQRLKPHDPPEVSSQPAAGEPVGAKENINNVAPASLTQDRQAPSIYINEGRRLHLNAAPIQQSIENAEPASPLECRQTFDKGKCRATSVVSLSDEASSERATAGPTAEIHTRPTTARTEIGTLNTPRVSQYVDSAAAQQPHDIETQAAVEVTDISSDNVQDVVRSTQLAIKVLETFQKRASAFINPSTIAAEPGLTTNPDSRSDTLYTGPRASSGENSAVPTTVVLETLDNAPSSSGLTPGNRNWTQRTISAPGIGVRVGVKRGDVKENGKKKDVGEPISVIILD